MGEERYKSVYVLAGKREDGTFGVIRSSGTIVNAYFNIKEAKKALEEGKSNFYETIILDVGAIVDQNLDRTESLKDISKIL